MIENVNERLKLLREGKATKEQLTVILYEILEHLKRQGIYVNDTIYIENEFGKE